MGLERRTCSSLVIWINHDQPNKETKHIRWLLACICRNFLSGNFNQSHEMKTSFRTREQKKWMTCCGQTHPCQELQDRPLPRQELVWASVYMESNAECWRHLFPQTKKPRQRPIYKHSCKPHPRPPLAATDLLIEPNDRLKIHSETKRQYI